MTEGNPVRVATPRDEDAIMSLCHLLHEENGLFPMSEDRVREMVRRALFPEQSISPALIGVIGAPSNLEAAIFMLVSQMWYSDQWHLEELYSFVRPDCRKSDYAKLLIDFAKSAAEQLAIPLVIGVLSNIRTAEKIRLYRRRLGDPAGAFFLYPNISANQKVA